MCVIENALNSTNAGAYKVNKHMLSSLLVVEFLELGIPGYLVNATLELTFIRQNASAHQYTGNKTYFFRKFKTENAFSKIKWFNASRSESSDGYEVFKCGLIKLRYVYSSLNACFGVYLHLHWNANNAKGRSILEYLDFICPLTTISES